MDAARAFGTGCFKDHRTYDLRGLSEGEIQVTFLSLLVCPLSTPSFLPSSSSYSSSQRRYLSSFDPHPQSVEHWKRFFADHETYFKVGRVSHPPIDPSTPLPPHCEPKKDAEQKARWGVVGGLPPDHPAAAAATIADENDNDAKAAGVGVEVEPDLDAKSGTKKPHEEL